MKDYAQYQGNNSITGSRDATREAFSMGLISDADIWMGMIKSRNITSHTYDEETVDGIVQDIVTNYLPLFQAFEKKMEEIENRNQQ